VIHYQIGEVITETYARGIGFPVADLVGLAKAILTIRTTPRDTYPALVIT
jgi:hypothetical protein